MSLFLKLKNKKTQNSVPPLAYLFYWNNFNEKVQRQGFQNCFWSSASGTHYCSFPCAQDFYNQATTGKGTSSAPHSSSAYLSGHPSAMMTLNSPHRTNRQVTKGRKYVCQSCCLQQNIYLLHLFSQHSAHCETWSIAEVRLAGCTASVSAQSAINCEMWYLIEFSKSSYPISPGHSSELPVIQQVIQC